MALRCTAHCNYYSTAIRIKDIQAKNADFTYKDYLEVNQRAEEVISCDPQTLTLIKTINQLISTEPCLHKVSEFVMHHCCLKQHGIN